MLPKLSLNDMSTGRRESWMWPVFSLAFFVCVCLVDARQVGNSAADSRNLPAVQSSRPVELAWGISEVHATLGKLFNFTIPKDAFDGEITDIKVGEVDRSALPKWLSFDTVTRTFTGLPFQESDLGTHYIAVTVLGPHETSAKDVFSLVVEETSGQSRCSSEAAETVLTLMLDVDWANMNMYERISLLSKFSNYLDIPASNLKVSHVSGSSSPSALLDSSALIAGPGNAKEVKYPGVKVSAVVGCDGNLDGNHKDLAVFVDESARDGSMARFTGVDIVGWHLTTTKPVPAPRLRRQSNFLHTAEPTPIEPTVAVVPHGSVHPTPALSAGVVVQTHGYGESSAYPGIQPTATLEYAVTPTAAFDEFGTSPIVITPPPVLPPPRPSRPGDHRINKPPTPAAWPQGGVSEVVGKYIHYKFISAPFKDPDTADLTVTLDQKIDWLEIAREGDTYVLRGMPMEENIGEYKINVTVDDGVNTLRHPEPLMVQVLPVKNEADTVSEIDVTLDEPFDGFKKDRRVLFVDTLRSYYQDPHGKNIRLRSIKKGSTQVAWVNETLNAKACSDPAISEVSKRVVDGDSVNPQFSQHFASAGFKVTKASAHKIGKCAGANAEKTSSNDIYISTVVPAVVVSSLLLLACCIACILFRKHRRGKMNTGEQDTVWKSHNKPVILPGENSDNNQKGHNGAGKKPTVLTQERPGATPVSPPTYSSSSTRYPGAHGHDYDERQNDPLLHHHQPPIVVTETQVRDTKPQSQPLRSAGTRP
ncbi:dystroglycan 1-like [Paramacrobiotus metropolitanus]|uniref:dystroglycan 1-like n=1 Tax=Paramacrobiotus metropolitanus TaxID=2943436 RepID=UPI002445A3F2|nr:dystroglycan 1-like [Paramacrobiotus metropolitanus]